MENKKSYYENDSRNMRDFNPRFCDLYQEYSDGQQGNHTFNLNGIIYVHNHHGGDPIPVGKAKKPTSSRSTAKPNRSPSQRERDRRESAGARRADSDGGMNRIGTNKTANRADVSAGANRTGARAGQPGIRLSAVGGYPGQKNGRNQQKNPASRMVRGMVVGFVALFFIAMIVPIVAALMNFDDDTDFSDEDTDEYEVVDIEERENDALDEPISEEGKIYLMGGYIQIGATAETLWETYDRPEFEPVDPVQPGENYYVTLGIGDKSGVGSVVLKNTGDKPATDFNGFVITDVSADYYTEYDEDFDSIRTETDCEIIGGITIGMDYTEALWALSEVCDNPDMMDTSESDLGHLVGYSEKYYYSISITNEEVSGIAVSLRDTEPEQ